MKNCTPLHYAAENNSREIGELLISLGANIDARDITYQNLMILLIMKVIENH